MLTWKLTARASTAAASGPTSFNASSIAVSLPIGRSTHDWINPDSLLSFLNRHRWLSYNDINYTMCDEQRPRPPFTLHPTLRNYTFGIWKKVLCIFIAHQHAKSACNACRVRCCFTNCVCPSIYISNAGNVWKQTDLSSHFLTFS